MKPVIYLDVDGVLWTVSNGAPRIASKPEIHYRASEGCEDFMRWALENCEVRWCTTWAMSGTMCEEGIQRLERYTRIPADVWRQVRPSLGWMAHKSEAIAWEEHHAGRLFAWIEDGLTPREIQTLAGNGFRDCYIHTDVFENPRALVQAHAELLTRWATDTTLHLPI